MLVANRYAIGEQLGEGGMGAVYRADDRLTGARVALKRVNVPEEQRGSQSGADSFRLALAQEFRMLATLRHPNIIGVLDYGFDEERQPYFTMELLDGARPILEGATAENTVERLIEVLQALAYLHRREVLHRDLKPGNILIDGDGNLKVLDFGLSTLRGTKEDSFVGTPIYVAPETLREYTPGPASDLYAVGVIAYEMLTETQPYQADSVGELMLHILKTPPDIEKIDSPVAPVVARLLEKDPAHRYPTAEAAIEALAQAANRPIPEESTAVRESFLQASAFVGREQELRHLERALRGAFKGKGSAWLIGGESGVGKSRLLDELRTRALITGATVLRGQGIEGGGTPYHLWRQPLRQIALSADLSPLEAGILQEIVPDIDQLIDGEVAAVPRLEGNAAQQRLALTIADVLCRQEGPVVLILEDLHWMSESLELLKVLTRMAPAHGVLVLGSYRDDERPDLPTVLDGMRTMHLDRLDKERIAALTESMIGAAGREEPIIDLIARETEGNVFFMIEVIRALAEETGRLSEIGKATLPDQVFAGGVQTVLQRRLSRVPDQMQPLLTHTAVAGRAVDIKMLPHLTDQPGDLDKFLTACINAAVFEVAEGRWRFAHDKLREALLDAIEDEAASHRKVAQAIEAAYPDDDAQAQILAKHWRQAGDTAKERSCALKAAARLSDLSQYEEAERFYRRAFEIEPQPGTEVKLAHVQTKLSQYEEAVAHYTAALEADLSAVERIQALNGHGFVALNQGDYDTARTLIEEAVEKARQLDATRELAEGLNHMGNLASYLGDPEAAGQHFEASLEKWRAIDDKIGIADTLKNLGRLAYKQGRFVDAGIYHGEAESIQREIGDRWGLAITLLNLGSVARNKDDYDSAHAYHSESLTLFREVGYRRGIAACLNNLGIVAGDRGDSEQARTYYEKGLTIQREIGDRQGIAITLSNLGHLAKERGDYATAHAYYQEGLSIEQEIGDTWGIASTLIKMGQLYVEQGQPTEAAASLREGLGKAHEIEAEGLVLEGIAGAADLMARQGQHQQAADWANVVMTHPANHADAQSIAAAVFERIPQKRSPESLSLEEVYAAIMERLASLQVT